MGDSTMPEEEEQPEEDTAEAQAQETPSLETLQAELDEADRERSQFRAMAQRAQADLANYRRRVEEERDEMLSSVTARLITKLLPIVDDFQRALAQTPASGEEAAWLEGIRMIERSFQTLLESEGVRHIEADGKIFDPWEHEALSSIESEDKDAGTVVSVIRPGYKLRGRILRAAQVTVAQGHEPEEQEPPDSGETYTPEEREA